MIFSLSSNFWPRRGDRSHRSADGFTLVEMLVAMALALLMMAALARSFSFVSTQVRDSRAETELSSQLRDISTRIVDEFDQRTCSMRPAAIDYEPNGYVLYHEGGVTDATSSLFRAEAIDGVVTSRAGRYGDFDDYLAFTATAPGESWFTGKVPRYLLEQKTAVLAGTPIPPSMFDPVVITSKYAEIIYYTTPEYIESSLPANPAFIDTDDPIVAGGTAGDGFPDRLRLHRRVLLIRPDLNIGGALPIQTQTAGGVSIPFMQADNWPTAANVQITAAAVANQAWAYGMGGVHQQCDLSVRRVRNGDGTITNRVAANSLEDLSNPENRFGHVNVPNTVLAGGTVNLPMSMPLLSLQNSPGIFQATATDGTTDLAPPRTPNVGPVVTSSIVSGLIRPELVLGLDRSHPDIIGDGWGADRLGEDVLLSGLLGFDIQVFDPDVQFIDTATFSAGNQTNLVVGPSQAGYRDALTQAIVESASASVPLNRFTERGGYVDLCYPMLAGGSLRGWDANRPDRRATANNAAIAVNQPAFLTPFSGRATVPTGGGIPLSRTAYTDSLYRSGRLVTNNGSIRLFQPAFDTFTSYFETDGITQAPINVNSSGVRTVYATPPVDPDLGSDGLDSDGFFGVDDPSELETSPPFLTQPDSLRVSIRIENSAVRAVRQQSVVLRD